MNQIIIYRNPAEAYFWNSIASSENIFPIIVSCFVFFIVLLISNSLICKLKLKFWYEEFLPLIIATICAIFTAWNMWI